MLSLEMLRDSGEEANPYLLDLIEHENRYPDYVSNLAEDLFEEWGAKSW